MRKIKLTPELGAKLKEFRIQYKIKSKDLADYIAKSPAYITKLEKGEILQITREELVTITNFITNSSDGYDVFFEKVTENVDFKSLENDLFFMNFDMVERKVPIPKELIDFIIKKINNLKINVETLTNYINQNEDLGNTFLSDHKINNEDIEVNVWYPYYEADSIDRQRRFIVINYPEGRINDLISYKIKKCEYLFVFVIIYHLLKYESKYKGYELNEKHLNKLSDETDRILSSYKFYSLSVKSKMENQINDTDELNSLMSNFDIENLKYINKILSNIKFLTDYDVDYTNNKLKQIVDNFEVLDKSFILSFMATNLSPLKDISVSKKKEFIKSVTELVDTILIKEENIEKY